MYMKSVFHPQLFSSPESGRIRSQWIWRIWQNCPFFTCVADQGCLSRIPDRSWIWDPGFFPIRVSPYQLSHFFKKLDGTRFIFRKYFVQLLTFTKNCQNQNFKLLWPLDLEIWASNFYGLQANIKISNGHNFFVFKDIDVISTLFCLKFKVL